MTRWLPSPVGGFWTLAEGPSSPEEPPPLRWQGERPTSRLRAGVAMDVAELPRGELCRFLLDGEPVDLTACVVEACDPDSGRVDLLAPVDDAPVDGGRPARLRLRLDGVRVVRRDSTLAGGPRSFRRVDCLQHDGRGVLRLSVWAEGSFPAVVLGAESLALDLEVLDAARPPYLLVMGEYFTSGLWDLATRGAGAEPVELDELDLSPSLRTIIRAWHDRWERDGRGDPGAPEVIAAALRARWPGSTVLVHR